MAALTTYYTLYDLPSDEISSGARIMAQFNSISGGARVISMIPYTLVYENGSSLTRYLPGQVSFEPISLSRLLDEKSRPLIAWFDRVAAGHLEYKNCSIVQFEMQDGKPVPTVIWDLTNVLPLAEPGFVYNAYQDSLSTSYKLKIQAEEITVSFP